MNNIQKTFIKARAALERIEKTEKAFEIKFMKEKAIVNADGSKADRVYMIDDDTLFNQINEEYSEAVNGCGIWDKLLKAKEEYKAAEKQLVKFALDVIPQAMGELKQDLSKAVETNYKVRQQVIETILKLDTRTI